MFSVTCSVLIYPDNIVSTLQIKPSHRVMIRLSHPIKGVPAILYWSLIVVHRCLL
jgi:hypothetical protein